MVHQEIEVLYTYLVIIIVLLLTAAVVTAVGVITRRQRARGEEETRSFTVTNALLYDTYMPVGVFCFVYVLLIV